MVTYRKRKGHDEWHWCTNCSNWPTSDYTSQTTEPSSDEQCNECKAKKKAGTCNT